MAEDLDEILEIGRSPRIANPGPRAEGVLSLAAIALIAKVSAILAAIAGTAGAAAALAVGNVAVAVATAFGACLSSLLLWGAGELILLLLRIEQAARDNGRMLVELLAREEEDPPDRAPGMR